MKKKKLQTKMFGYSSSRRDTSLVKVRLLFFPKRESLLSPKPSFSVFPKREYLSAKK